MKLLVRMLATALTAQIAAAQTDPSWGGAPDALIIGADPLFSNSRSLLITLAARHAMPAIYINREFALSGGLASYGIHFPDAYRQAGHSRAEFSKARSRPICRSCNLPNSS